MTELATDFFGFASALTSQELRKLHQLREFLEAHARPHLAGWWERAECPAHLRAGLAELNLDDDPAILGEDRRPRPIYTGFRNLELARFDLSISVIYGGQAGMFRRVVWEGGSDAQRQDLDRKIGAFEYTGCFALTEPDHGSDVAKGMETTARRVGDTWTLSGRKRWIGNAAISDVIVVVAADAFDRTVKAFLVPRVAEGVSLTDIDGKLSLRMVRNADIVLKDVQVHESQRLQRIESFGDIAAILAFLRPDVAWHAGGMQIGAYEAALAYAKERKQFGRSIAGFQLIQEKLVRMLGNATASVAMAVQLTRMREAGEGQDEHSALTKAWVADRLRETVALGREIVGGEGIRVQHDVARFFADAEAVYTYEGTREMNTLIVGRALTGMSAFTS